MPARTLVVVLAFAAVACTGGTTTSDGGGGGSSSPSPLPTTNLDAKIVPGVWTYELRGLKATFTWKEGSTPALAVKNASGLDLAAPALYVVTQEQNRIDAALDGAAPLANGDQGQYAVTFPKELTRDDIGLVVLETGDENWGALAPKVIEG
jgi:hypothetical protein